MSRPRKTSSRFRGQLGLGQGRPVSYRRPSGAHVVYISDQGRPLAQFVNGRPALRPAEGPRATIYVVCRGRSYQDVRAVNSQQCMEGLCHTYEQMTGTASTVIRVLFFFPRGELPPPDRLATLDLPLTSREEDGGSSAAVVESLAQHESETLADGKSSEKAPVKGGERTLEKAKASLPSGSTPPFLLSECLPPVPAKLVAKIVKGDYVDMAELLRDNIEAERQRTTDSSVAGLSTSQAHRREVPDFLSWLQCFGVYVGIVATHKPEKLRQLMAYQTLMICEARRCGGDGWQGYDTMFRQLAASTDWGQLNSALYTVTFMAQQNGKGKTYHYCLEADHQSDDCSLAPRKPGNQVVGQGGFGLLMSVGVEACRPWSASGMSAEPRRVSLTKYGRGGRWSAYQGSQLSAKRVCYAWNEGSCEFWDQCWYRHICVKCEGDHPAMSCKAMITKPSGKAE